MFEEAIKKTDDRFAGTFNCGDINALMGVHLPRSILALKSG